MGESCNFSSRANRRELLKIDVQYNRFAGTGALGTSLSQTGWVQLQAALQEAQPWQQSLVDRGRNREQRETQGAWPSAGLSPWGQGQSAASRQSCRSWAEMCRGVTTVPGWGTAEPCPGARPESTRQETSCWSPNAFLERRLCLPSRVGCLYSRCESWDGGMVWVRDVKPMCWKQDLMQMLGGREGGRVGGRGAETGEEKMYIVLGFVFHFFLFFFFFFKEKKKLFDF